MKNKFHRKIMFAIQVQELLSCSIPYLSLKKIMQFQFEIVITKKLTLARIVSHCIYGEKAIYFAIFDAIAFHFQLYLS